MVSCQEMTVDCHSVESICAHTLSVNLLRCSFGIHMYIIILTQLGSSENSKVQ